MPEPAAGPTTPIGINHFGRLPLEEFLRRLPPLGYGAVDFSAAAGRLAADRDALARVRRVTRELGLVPAGTHFRSFGFAFLAPSERRRAFAREAVEDVRAAAFLGARAVAFHLGNDLGDGPAGPPGAGDAAGDARLAEANAEALRAAARAAEQEGVALALENHCHGWGDRWEHLRAVAALLGSGSVGFTLDTGHAVVAGQRPEALARQMGRRLVLTHLHDNDGTADQHRPAGRAGPNGALPGGTVDWAALVAALRDVGYPGRNAWVLEGGTQLAGDEVAPLLAAHLGAFAEVLGGAPQWGGPSS